MIFFENGCVLFCWGPSALFAQPSLWDKISGGSLFDINPKPLLLCMISSQKHPLRQSKKDVLPGKISGLFPEYSSCTPYLSMILQHTP